jgi:hypothetical protein
MADIYKIKDEAQVKVDKNTMKAILEYCIRGLTPIRELTANICMIRDFVKEEESIAEKDKVLIEETIQFLNKKRDIEVKNAMPRWTGTVAELMPSPAECARLIESYFSDIDDMIAEGSKIASNPNVKDTMLKTELYSILRTKWTSSMLLISAVINNESYPIRYRLPLARGMISADTNNAVNIKKVLNSGVFTKNITELLEIAELRMCLRLQDAYKFVASVSNNTQEIYHAQEKLEEIKENIQWLNDKLIGQNKKTNDFLSESEDNDQSEHEGEIRKLHDKMLSKGMSNNERFFEIEHNMALFSKLFTYLQLEQQYHQENRSTTIFLRDDINRNN